jgi:hypothetical protein
VIFQALQTSAASLTSIASVTSLASTASKAIFPQKDFLVLMVWFFTNIWYLFLPEAVEARLCYFF